MSAESIQKLKDFLSQSVLAWIGLVIAILAMAALVQWVRARFRGDAGLADGKDEILARMEELHREGDLTDEEYRSIKGRITKRTDS